MTLREFSILKMCALVIWMLFLVSCASNSKNNNFGHSQTPVFPDIEKAWIKEGIYINPENVRKIEVGMTKQQVHSLLGKPHFNEGFFGIKLWNYIINYREEDGHLIRCQYQLAYDKDFLVEGIAWQNEECKEKILNANKLHNISYQPIDNTTTLDEPSDPVAKVEVFSEDVYFPFAKSSLKDLPEKTYDQLHLFLAKVNERIKKVQEVRVTGHADIVGDANHNLPLSLRRAETIRGILIDMGIHSNLIHTSGFGSQMPTKNCLPNQHLTSLIACGQPNRRVNITVSGEGYALAGIK